MSRPSELSSFINRRLAFYLSFFVGVAALVLIWLLYPKGFDYPGAIADNITYFQVPFLTAFGVDAHLNTKQLCASGRVLWLGNLPSLDCVQSTWMIASFVQQGLKGLRSLWLLEHNHMPRCPAPTFLCETASMVFDDTR